MTVRRTGTESRQRRAAGGVALVCFATALAGCGAGGAHSRSSPIGTAGAGTTIPPALLAGARPIGRGPRFTPPVTGRPTGRCAAPLGRRYSAHIELFADDRVVLLATGIGAGPPRRARAGRLIAAACFGAAVTLDPTGTIYYRPGAPVTLAEVFSAWGQPLSGDRIASFSGARVRTYVDGRPRQGSPGALRLTRHAEIVLEIGARVPPHRAFTFPAPPPSSLR